MGKLTDGLGPKCLGDCFRLYLRRPPYENEAVSRHFYLLPVLAIVCLADSVVAVEPVPADYFERQVRPVLQEFCAGCHDGVDNEVEFMSTGSAQDIAESRALWRNVANQLRNRTMPPADDPQPKEEDRLRISQWIDSTLRNAACTGEAYAGVVTTRRLNRREYANTIRALTGVELDFATTFPVDSGGGEGFDNNGETLFLPPLLLERYLEAAQQVVDAAVIPPPMKVLFLPKEMYPLNESIGKSRIIQAGQKVDVLVPIPVAGRYKVPVGIVPLDEGDLTVGVEVDDIPAGTMTYRRYGEKGVANQEECDVRLTRGLHKIGIRAPHDHNVEIVRLRVVLQPEPTTPVQVGRHMELLGVKPAHSPANPTAAAKRTIRRFASKAFRRPISKAEENRFFELYLRAIQRGDSYEEGIKLAMKGILVAPEFLFRIESTPSSHAIEPLTDHELATRLSYFLWSTMPDERLLAIAEESLLNSNNQLSAQLDRMLDDPRSAEFFSQFVGQWLGTRDVGGRRAATENSIQDIYTPFIAADMRQQAVMLLEHVIREDRSVLELLDADYTFVTGKLGKFYGMPNVAEIPRDQFQRVELGDERSRGGLLGLGGVLVLTSHISERQTSPVLRGAWVLDTLLGTRVPAPPDDVPALDRKRGKRKKLTLRETLEQHRENQACAACHNLMDPIGFGLENFDFLGRWRADDNGKPLDTSGSMPSGEQFSGPNELKQVLLKRKDEFTRQLVRKLLGYALGRSLVDADECTIEQLMKQLAQNGYRGKALLRSIVLSTPFRNKSLDRSSLNKASMKQHASD